LSPARRLIAPTGSAQGVVDVAIAIALAKDRMIAEGGHSGGELLPHQIPPDGDWHTWVIVGGRGSGKTHGGTSAVETHLEALGPAARVGIGAPTIADARDVDAEGPSGLITVLGSRIANYNRSLGEARHIKGGYVKFLGSEKPSRWNGPQWTMLWWDELALCNKDSFDQSQFGLRLGENPRTIVTTTPKNRKFVKDLLQEPGVVSTRATSYDNPHLSERALALWRSRWEGTRLGRQELNAEFVDDVEGAYWQRDWLEEARLSDWGGYLQAPDTDDAPRLARLVVAVDPATTAGEDSDYTGIVVAALGRDGFYYVLEGGEYKLSPHGWANKAVQLYREYHADWMIGEVNNGGDMVESTVHTVDPSINFKQVRASRGKEVRAEPIAALYERRKVRHVGAHMAAMEDQMCAFPVENDNDDMVDALVYALTELSTGTQFGIW